MLSDKLEKLATVNDKMEATEVLNCFDHNSLSRELLLKGVHSANSSDFKILTSPKAASQGKPSPSHASSILRTGSTWANFTKENFRGEA